MENKQNHPVHKRRAHAIVFAITMLVIGFLLCTKLGQTSASRQWGQFLNQDFWNAAPNTGNIIYSLFGDGTPGSTAYTRNRDSSCIASSIVHVPNSFAGGNAAANTIYILDSGNYTLTTHMTMNNCSALVASGIVTINGGASKHLVINGKSHVIIDGITISNSDTVGVEISSSNNISINGIQSHTNPNHGILANNSAYLSISNSQFIKNTQRGIGLVGDHHVTINNIMSYNNGAYGIHTNSTSYAIGINNSQCFNNAIDGIEIETGDVVIHNSISYNNAQHGININTTSVTGIVYLNNNAAYNNGNAGIYTATGTVNFYGTTMLFDNGVATGGNVTGAYPASPTGLGWSVGTINTTSTIDYDRVTNPINTANTTFFTGSNRTALRGVQSFTLLQPLRYIFGLNILKQTHPVTYLGTGMITYGSDVTDFDSTKYIAEVDSHFSPAYMSIVNQYFGSGSLYTQNWSGNGCSLGSFQVITLHPGNYPGTYTFQDHSIYILEAGEYTLDTAGNGFTFGGNCIAIIGSGDVRIDHDNTNVTQLLSADGKRNIILDNLKLDGYYYGNGNFSNRTTIGINFAGSTYNTTINDVQSYNNALYGIFLGVGSHHTTIINSQTYNNREAGIYFYLASHHNVINNSMTYNNSGYGIWFANGSRSNAMNNFQSFNNEVGVFGDLTTKDNIINRAMLYNNNQYGLLLKNSSGNILNDVQLYSNTTGIKVELGSLNNVFNGDLILFDNGADFEGTTADDSYLAAGMVSPFSLGSLTLGSHLMDCSYVTNPNFSGSTTYLLNSLSGCILTGTDYSVFNGYFSDINYLFGTNIYKQNLPVSYTATNTIQTLSAQYDANKYIAEVFAIRDAIPDNVNFTFSGNEPSTLYTSTTYVAYGINTTVPLSLSIQPATTGYLIINGSNVGMTGTIVNGDTVQITLTSSASFYGTVAGILSANGGPIASSTITTRGPDMMPDTGALAFTNISGAPLSSYTGSTTTVSGLETGVLASISTGWIVIYSGGSLVSSGSTGTVWNNNQVLAMISSSAQYATTTTGIVTIGQGSGSFTVTTIPNIYSPILTFTDPVSSGAVLTDTISVQASGGISPVLYKFITNPSDCTSSGASLYTGLTITLTGENYNGKYFCVYATLSGYAMPLVSQYPISIDRTGPTTPTLTYPANADEVYYVVLETTGAYDTGAGMSGYHYQIADDYNFVDIVSTGFIATTGTSFSPNDFTETTGDFYWKVQAVDRLGLSSSRSAQRSFVVIDDEDFSFGERDYAAIDTDYMSNDITINGLRTYGMALATVSEGTLYKNGIDRGTSSYVQNGDTLAIELRSSDQYDDSVASTLTVANRETDFIITTASDGDACTLSSEDRGRIQVIFNSLVAQYSGDQSRYDQFLYTMRSMLQDQIDLTNDCNLRYLDNLITTSLHGNISTGGIDVSNYIAPNCKEYHIGYNTGKIAYTSPDFRSATYFATRNALTRYIDSKNPGDCHVSATINGTWYFTNTDPTKHIAPNGKLYTIQHETQGYTSAEFSVKKYFSTLVALRKYLDTKNPPFPIWSHTVDRTFTPVNYAAPNGKSYTIYKTNRGYMSYKLLNVKYYSTLDAIKAFINKNNPK